ncbi:hypothetical protein RJT34_27330 [Clitoria ternatea]|uniref:Uncharacterized protein n=1 Tax=Clitoria ternatea TaxID=43366 RepID=A0AAN9I9N3_CLITE
MVLLVEKFAKLYFKLENRHHPITQPHPEELSSSLLAFKSHLSKSFGQLALDLKPGSETLSLAWFQRCFGLLPFINKAFAKLVVDIDYPMSKWEVGSTEGYLSYTLSLLELLNSMSSSLSHLGRARLSLAHGLTLVENSPPLAQKYLKAIQFQQGCVEKNFGEEFHTKAHDKERIFGKEWVVHEAVKEMRSIGFWVCGVLLSCLSGDGKAYLEQRKFGGGFDGSLAATLDCEIGERLMEKVSIFREIEEVNDVVAELIVASDEVRDDAAKELKTKMHLLERLLDDTSKEVDNLFADVMTQRSELIDGFRMQKQQPH